MRKRESNWIKLNKAFKRTKPGQAVIRSRGKDYTHFMKVGSIVNLESRFSDNKWNVYQITSWGFKFEQIISEKDLIIR